MPLSLVYAETGHTFQGQSVGPGHAIPCIIVPHGKMEFICPGFLFIFVSRPTAIGMPENIFESDFFYRNEMNRQEQVTLQQLKMKKTV